MSSCIVDFGQLGGRAYAGRPNGQAAYEYFHIDKMMSECEVVSVKFPDDTKTLTSSYFLGCFGKTIIEMGSEEAFRKKFKMENPEKLNGIISKCIKTALIATSY